MKTLTMLIATCAISSLWMGCKRDVIEAVVASEPKTFCNPLNIDYRFMLIDEGEGIREAADPVVVSYHGDYLLFASKSSGY